MEKADTFLLVERKIADKQTVDARLGHYGEFYLEMAEEEQKIQAERCMTCGVPFCHNYGCPLGNLIPEWNEHLSQGRLRQAVDLLHLTNNFPEITGRVCPALCEAACTLGLENGPVTVRQNEQTIIERAFKDGLVQPLPPARETGFKVAVIGSGPAGLAAAQQIRRAGHKVVVYEKADRPGGLLRYGIPDFKLEKKIIDRRLDQMEREGVVFETSVEVGPDISASYLLKRFDAVCICIGAGQPRDLPVPGRELDGIHFALDYLIQQNRRVSGLPVSGPEITATGKKVVIIGGGDTGADCLGTALRQKAASVRQFEILPKPPEKRDVSTPWPLWPHILRTSPAHEEGGQRRWSVATSAFQGRDGQVARLLGHEVAWREEGPGGPMKMEKLDGSDFTMEVDLVLLSMGFTGPVKTGLVSHLGLDLDARGNVRVGPDMMTSVPKVFAAGDANTGAWLVVRAIAAGRRLARQVDLFLTGQSLLPDAG